MSGNGATGDSLALERLILEHEWAGALPLAADLMAQGSSDARRWYGLCQWQLGNTNEAELALRECVSLGDMAVSLYIIALACDQGVDVDLHDPQLTWVRTEIGTAYSGEICGRITGALSLISNTDANSSVEYSHDLNTVITNLKIKSDYYQSVMLNKRI